MREGGEGVRFALDARVSQCLRKRQNELYISSQYKIMHEIHDLGHCRICASFCFLWLCKLDWCAIAEKASS